MDREIVMLDDKLRELAESDVYPFHMPGHKRRLQSPADPYRIDITEIEGFDDLHDPQGVILEEEEAAAAIYGADRSYLMVNGSTGGNLAAVFAATHDGDTVIMGRNCHKSVYHAAELRRLRTVYVYSQLTPEGMAMEAGYEGYRQAIDRHPEAAAVIVTSPTYEGMTEPLPEIAAYAHTHGMKVIVDAAHGAHLGFDPYFPPSPVDSGADLVIMSLHKTLPALTQTAVLHCRRSGDDFWQSRVEHYLNCFQTSSPSYVLMDSMSLCLRFLQQGRERFAAYAGRLREFYRQCKTLRRFYVEARPGQDPSKIVIFAGDSGLSGGEISRRLREESRLALEMSSFSYCLAMSSVMDESGALGRLFDGLRRMEEGDLLEKKSAVPMLRQPFAEHEAVLPLWEAAASSQRVLPLAESAGCVAASEVCLYPPGIPVLVAGERIKKEDVELLERAAEAGLKITGCFRGNEGGVSVVN